MGKDRDRLAIDDIRILQPGQTGLYHLGGRDRRLFPKQAEPAHQEVFDEPSL